MRKMKNYLKLGILLFGISLLLWNCQNDNKLIEQQSIFQTVSYEEALNFFNSDSESKNFKTKSAVYSTPDLNNISQEVISNSEELLTIIPAEIVHKDCYSRILLLKINGKIESIVFTMLPNQNLVNTNYTGIVIITDLSGKFINGYRIEDSVLKTQISINKETSNKYLAGKSSSDGCVEHTEYREDCYWCTQYLDEVVVIGYSNRYIPVTGLYIPDPTEPGDPNSYYLGWDPGPGEGTSNTDNTSCPPGKIKDSNTGKCVCSDGYIEDANGNCVKKPCYEINSQITNTDFKAKINELNKLTNKEEESGYVQNKDGTFTLLPVINGGHSLDLEGISYSDINGFIHTHLNDFPTGKIVDGLPEINEIYRIFSPADVLAFLAIAKRTDDNSSVYATVITSSGDYTLKFTGDKNHITGLKEAKDYKEDYIALMKKYKSDKERGFLHFLKDCIKVAGIELYKLHKPIFSSEIEIQNKTLDSQGKVEKTECK